MFIIQYVFLYVPEFTTFVSNTLETWSWSLSPSSGHNIQRQISFESRSLLPSSGCLRYCERFSNETT